MVNRSRSSVKHGHTQQIGGRGGKVRKSPSYQSWSSMNDRCYNDSHKAFDRYGKRGIEVCERWRRGTPNAFVNFLEDMGERPMGKTLDREDNDLGYYKGNCRWADKSTQNANQARFKRAPVDEPDDTEWIEL